MQIRCIVMTNFRLEGAGKFWEIVREGQKLGSEVLPDTETTYCFEFLVMASIYLSIYLSIYIYIIPSKGRSFRLQVPFRV